jgi:addiction module HigA family antidote
MKTQAMAKKQSPSADTPGEPSESMLGTPGDVLRRLFMLPLGLTAYRISKEMSVPPITLSEILRGKRAISATMACRLGVYFGVDPQFLGDLLHVGIFDPLEQGVGEPM